MSAEMGRCCCRIVGVGLVSELRMLNMVVEAVVRCWVCRVVGFDRCCFLGCLDVIC